MTLSTPDNTMIVDEDDPFPDPSAPIGSSIPAVAQSPLVTPTPPSETFCIPDSPVTPPSPKAASYRKPVPQRRPSLESLASLDDSPADPSDEALEALAAEFASQEPDEPWELGLTGPLASSLRRRFTTKASHPPPPYRSDLTASTADLTAGGGGAVPVASPSPPPMTAKEAETRRAIEEMEDLEVAAFLERVGRQLQDVRVAGPVTKVPFPKKRAFARLDGTIDWRAFAHAVSPVPLHCSSDQWQSFTIGFVC